MAGRISADILSFWHDRGLTLRDEEGFRFGDPRQPLLGIGVAWMGTVSAIERAEELGLNCLIVHEDLFYPPGYARRELEPHLPNPVNVARLEGLRRAGSCVFRAHSSADRLCILDDFRVALGLPEPTVSDGNFRVCEIEPVPAGDLAAEVKRRLGLESVRFSGDRRQSVRRVGLPWGGLGLSINAGFVEGCLARGADVLIAGETDDYSMRAVVDVGVPMIETSHAESENIGLRHFARMLADEFPDVPVHFIECPRPWITI